MKKQWLLLLFPVVLIGILVAVRFFSKRTPPPDPALTKPAVVLEGMAPAGNAPIDRVPSGDARTQQTLQPEVVEKLSTTLEKYIKENPKATDLADAYFNLGNLYYQAGQYQKAIDPLTKALTHRPYDSDAHYTLGNTYDKLQRYQDAAKSFEALTKIEPKNDSVYYNLGNAYFNQKKLKEAAEQYQTALSINPKNGPAHYALGLTYLNLRRSREAIGPLEQALALDANNAQAHYSLALAKLEIGDKKGAQDQHELLKKLNSPFAGELDKKINEAN